MIVADFALCLHFDTRLYSMDCQAIITVKIGSIEVLFAFCFFDPMSPKFQKPFFFSFFALVSGMGWQGVKETKLQSLPFWSLCGSRILVFECLRRSLDVRSFQSLSLPPQLRKSKRVCQFIVIPFECLIISITLFASPQLSSCKRRKNASSECRNGRFRGSPVLLMLAARSADYIPSKATLGHSQGHSIPL